MASLSRCNILILGWQTHGPSKVEVDILNLEQCKSRVL
jgi:hypothetical protein